MISSTGGWSRSNRARDCRRQPYLPPCRPPWKLSPTLRGNSKRIRLRFRARDLDPDSHLAGHGRPLAHQRPPCRPPSRHVPSSRSSWSAATTKIEACSSWSDPAMSSVFRLSCGSTCSRRRGTPTSRRARTHGSTAPERGSRSGISGPSRSIVTSSNSRASDSILGFSSRRLSSLRPHSTTRSTWDGSTTGSAMPSTSGSATGSCRARGSGTNRSVTRSAPIASWRRRSSVPTSAQASGRKVNRSRMSITSRCWRTR